MRNSAVAFNFNIYNGEQFIGSNSSRVTLTPAVLMEVADVIRNNGGHRMPLVDLPKICDLMTEEAFMELVNLFPEDENLDNFEIVLQEEMPQELMDTLEENKLIVSKSVDVEYSYNLAGEKKTATANFQCTPETFRAMVQVVNDNATDLWAHLKERFPHAHYEMMDYINEIAFKEGIRDEGNPRNPEVFSFPYQVFQNL